jgi:uncharacterized membrane protein
MAIVIHFNTFFGEEAEEKKLDLLDKLESEFSSSSDAKQVFEDPENEEDGFDLWLKYDSLSTIDYDLLHSIATEYELYVMVYDLDNKSKLGYWYDEEDEWVDDEITESMEISINAVFA